MELQQAIILQRLENLKVTAYEPKLNISDLKDFFKSLEPENCNCAHCGKPIEDFKRSISISWNESFHDTCFGRHPVYRTVVGHG